MTVGAKRGKNVGSQINSCISIDLKENNGGADGTRTRKAGRSRPSVASQDPFYRHPLWLELVHIGKRAHKTGARRKHREPRVIRNPVPFFMNRISMLFCELHKPGND